MWADIESKVDFLNYGEIADLAIDVIRSRPMLPTTVGIFGSWGSGKSSMLRLIEKGLEESADRKNYVFIHFDAWLYQGYDDARSALMASIGSTLLDLAVGANKQGFGKKLRALLRRLNWWKVGGYAAEGVAMGLGAPGAGKALVSGAKAVGRLVEDRAAEGDVDAIKGAGTEVVGGAKTILKPKEVRTLPKLIDGFRKDLKAIVETLNKTIVVFVDNLDRCLPDQTIHTLETLRLFLSMENTAFVIAADEHMIRHSVKTFLGDPGGKLVTDYIDKLIQVPIRVPQLGVQEIRAYLFMLFATAFVQDEAKVEALRKRMEESLQCAWNSDPIPRSEAVKAVEGATPELARAFEIAERIAPILAASTAVGGNPRIVKRMLNVIRMRTRLAQRRKINIDEGVIAKLALFERCASPASTLELYRQIQACKDGKLESLKRLETEPETTDLPTSWKEESFLKEWAKLEPALGGLDLRAAAYLSRETVALSGIYSGLSPAAEAAFKVLLNIPSKTSRAAKEAIAKVPASEKRTVMEALTAVMRRETDFDTAPAAFNGAMVLAEESQDAGQVLNDFCNSLGTTPSWLKAAVKNEKWYSEGKA